MPQYQVDSERIQSSSAAVATSISQIRQAVGGMYTNLNALQDAWRFGGHPVHRGSRTVACGPTADGGLTRVHPTLADASLHRVR